MLSLESIQNAGFSLKIPIYNQDGDKLAVAVGSRLIRTEAGKKSGLKMREMSDRTVCELDRNTIFELKRTAPTSVKAEAELYAPNGYFIKYKNALPEIIKNKYASCTFFNILGT